jgi:hypothetical protein
MDKTKNRLRLVLIFYLLCIQLVILNYLLKEEPKESPKKVSVPALKTEIEKENPQAPIVKKFIKEQSIAAKDNDDVIKLQHVLQTKKLQTDPFLILAVIKKESGLRNIPSFSESDVFGFVQMKFSTIQYLNRLYPALPKIKNGQDFLNNVEAQVLYCDQYFAHLIKTYNLQLENEKDLKYAIQCYNGGPGKYYASKPQYYNSIFLTYTDLKNEDTF